MLSSSTREHIREILTRMSKGSSVKLSERLLIHEYADKDQTISNWLRRALRNNLTNKSTEEIDRLIYELDICSADPQSIYNPNEDDLGEWFSGAPSWVARS